jgi:hypothetical protein
VYLSIYLWLYSPLLGLGRFFSFLILYTVGRTPWTGDQPVARPLPIHRTTQKQNKLTQTSMSWVGFEPTIPLFERAKTVHALDSAASVIGRQTPYRKKILNVHSVCRRWTTEFWREGAVICKKGQAVKIVKAAYVRHNFLRSRKVNSIRQLSSNQVIFLKKTYAAIVCLDTLPRVMSLRISSQT